MSQLLPQVFYIIDYNLYVIFTLNNHFFPIIHIYQADNCVSRIFVLEWAQFQLIYWCRNIQNAFVAFKFWRWISWRHNTVKKDTKLQRQTQRPQKERKSRERESQSLMASNTFSLSIAAVSSSAILLSNTKTSFSCQQPHERTFLSSSLIATRTSIYKNTSTTRPTSLRKGSRGFTCSASSSSSSALPSALLFDCDGVLVDTEKDGHRISFNDTFKEVCILSCFFCVLSLMVHWSLVWY